MVYVQNIVAQESVQELIFSSEENINAILETAVPSIAAMNGALVKESLDSFIEDDDLLTTYENIAQFSENDMATFIESIAVVLGDEELTEEDKIEIINYALSDEDEEEVFEFYTDPKDGVKYSTGKSQVGSGKVKINKFYKNPTGKAPAAKAPTAKAPAAKAPVAKAPVAKAPVAKAPVAAKGTGQAGLTQPTGVKHGGMHAMKGKTQVLSKSAKLEASRRAKEAGTLTGKFKASKYGSKIHAGATALGKKKLGILGGKSVSTATGLTAGKAGVLAAGGLGLAAGAAGYGAYKGYKALKARKARKEAEKNK